MSYFLQVPFSHNKYAHQSNKYEQQAAATIKIDELNTNKQTSIPGLSNSNHSRAAHLSAVSLGGPHEAKKWVFYRFSERF